MSVWSCKPMSVLVSSVRKDSKLQEALTLLSDNSNSWNLFCSSMVVKRTDVIHCSYFTTSTRISCTSSHNSTSVSTLHSLDSHCTSSSFTRCITLQWPPCQSCFTVCSISNTKRTLTCKWIYQKENYKDTSWETHYFTELELKATASPRGFSWDGYCTLSSTPHSYSSHASGLWLKRPLTSPMEKTLVSGLVACSLTVCASSLQTQFWHSNISLTTGSVPSSSSCAPHLTSCSSGSSVFPSGTRLITCSCQHSRWESATSSCYSLWSRYSSESWHTLDARECAKEKINNWTPSRNSYWKINNDKTRNKNSRRDYG